MQTSAPGVQNSPRAPLRVLILKPSSLGDIIHTLPSADLLRQRFPEARIEWVISPEWAPLLAGNPAIDGLIPFPRAALRGMSAPLRFFLWARRALPRRAALAVDFQGLLRTALMGRIARARRFAGFSNAREGAPHFYSQRIRPPPGAHSVERYLALAAAASHGCHPDKSDFPRQSQDPAAVRFTLPPGNPPAGFDLGTPWLAIHPYSRGREKSLGPDVLQTLVSALAPHRVVLAGRHPDPPAISGAIDLINRTTLGELIWLMRHAHGVISVDSGPMHVAAACNPGVLGLHSWSDPGSVGPYNPSAHIWQNGVIRSMNDILEQGCAPAPSPMPGVESALLIARWVRARWL